MKEKVPAEQAVTRQERPLPPAVQEALGELVGAAQEGLMALSVGDKGPWVMGGGWEYNAVLLASLMTVAAVGPGRLSLDSVLGMERAGLGWALAATGAGALGAAAAVFIPPGEAGEASAQEAGRQEAAAP